MPLQPSLRQKKRYILFEIIPQRTPQRNFERSEEISLKEEISFPEVKKAVEEALLKFLGEWGTAKAAPLLLGERYKNNHFILKVNHTAVDEVKSALILIKSIKNIPVIIRSKRVSGSLKKLE